MEGEGGIVLIDPGLVIILLSPLSSPEPLSPEQVTRFISSGRAPRSPAATGGPSQVEAGVVINDRVEAPLSLSHVRSGK